MHRLMPAVVKDEELFKVDGSIVENPAIAKGKGEIFA